MPGWPLLAIVVIAAAVLVTVAWNGRRFGVGFERVVRCRAGHLFTTTWVPGVSLKAVRLWNVRFQRCPAGRHWTLVHRVDESRLTPDELQVARSRHDVRIP